MLNIPAPTLPAPSLPLSQPAKTLLAGLTYGDGSAVAPTDVSSIGVFTFRGASSAAEFWDAGAKAWRPTPADAEIMTLQPLAAAPQSGATGWTATLLALGQKDAAGNDVYSAASGGNPRYYLRGFAHARHAGHDELGLSALTPGFTFVDLSSNARFKTELEPAAADSAHRVRMLLRGDALQTAGYLEIRSQPAFEIEISNCNGAGVPLATVVLRGNGDIQLIPGGGGHVIVEGDLETQHILYAPAGGGAKQWLP